MSKREDRNERIKLAKANHKAVFRVAVETYNQSETSWSMDGICTYAEAKDLYKLIKQWEENRGRKTPENENKVPSH